MNRIAKLAAVGLLMALPAALPAQSASSMSPAQAVAAAAQATSHEVAGSFEMTVGSTGAVGFDFFLNSAADYHDPDNLTVELHPEAVNALQAQLGGDPDVTLKGKRVRVAGVARRIEVGPGTYQTRVAVDRRDQLTILD